MHPVTPDAIQAQPSSDGGMSDTREHSIFHSELFTKQPPFVKQCQDGIKMKQKPITIIIGVSVYHLLFGTHTDAQQLPKLGILVFGTYPLGM